LVLAVGTAVRNEDFRHVWWYSVGNKVFLYYRCVIPTPKLRNG
jgi:hypothetical protein